MNTPHHKLIQTWLTGLLAACLLIPGMAWARIGEVTLVIGQLEVQRLSGPSASLAKGDPVLEGDIIKTTASGHVHIRFIDGGLVSVRPNSVFTIHEFRFNPDQPSASVVRLSLDRGEVRAVSGQATQEAKDRFRLNTPLVAIGVKGTDFTTQATEGVTRVTVNHGAIVMAPFDQSCRVDALGVCTGARARDLTADMVGMALVYRSGATDPSLQLISGNSEPNKVNQLDRQLRDNAERAASASINLDEVIPAARLVWGRWSQTPLPGDALTVGFRQALQGNEVTVGDGYHFLFRQPGVANQLPGQTSQASFRLQSSSAQYRTPGNEILPAQITGGSFNVDFAQRSFATQLLLNAHGIDPQQLQYSGSIDVQTGIFLSGATTGQGSLAGALGLDARQAGYLFTSPLGNGSLSGATLWGR
jgi:hypothetical protein